MDHVRPYSREELRAAADGRWPDRGEKCDECGGFVPTFADLTAEDRARIHHLVLEGRTELAQEELMAATGAPPRFAKIWVVHQGSARPRFPGPPCPYCGSPLASSMARQCLHCHRDWHNSATKLEVRQLRLTDADLFRAVRLAALVDSPEAFGETLEQAEQTDWSSRTRTVVENPDRAVFAALLEGAAIGMSFVKCDHDSGSAFLGGMWVQAPHRRSGIGELLFAEVVSFARARGQHELKFWVNPSLAAAVSFYEARGAVPTGRTDILRTGSSAPIHEFLVSLV